MRCPDRQDSTTNLGADEVQYTRASVTVCLTRKTSTAPSSRKVSGRIILILVYWAGRRKREMSSGTRRASERVGLTRELRVQEPNYLLL